MSARSPVSAPGYVVSGSIAVVTGGGAGIGQALCQYLAKGGAKAVMVVDLEFSKAESVATSLPRGVGVPVRANVGSEMDIRRVIVAALAKFGRIDAFFCNAGIPSNGGIDVPNDEWNRIWQVNVMQIVYAARHLFPRWEQQDHRGFFCVTASAAGLLTQVGSLPYSTTKHAAVGVAEWLRITYEQTKITVTCACPQAVQTGMLPPVLAGKKGSGHPAEKDGIMKPEDVARVMVEGMGENRFMVLPHPDVAKYFNRKASDYDRWISGMGRLHQAMGSVMAQQPNLSSAKL